MPDMMDLNRRKAMTDSRKLPWRSAASMLILASSLVCWSCSTDSASPSVTDKSKWNLTLDVGGSITQALLEPYIHKGVEQNLVLSAYWDF